MMGGKAVNVGSAVGRVGFGPWVNEQLLSDRARLSQRHVRQDPYVSRSEDGKQSTG